MKIINKLLVTFIILSLLISYIFPFVSFAKYDSYLALGDSISAGTVFIGEVECYPDKLRKELNISHNNYNNLSIPVETTEYFYDTIRTTEYTQKISEADLITITIGSNEIFEILAEGLSYATGIPLPYNSDFLVSVTETFLNSNMVEKIKIILAFCEFFTTQDISQKIQAKALKYEEYWKKSISYIKEVNPSATIVATEFYNPYYGVQLSNFNLGNLVDQIIQEMNKILYNYSNSETEYKIAKIYDVFNSTNPRLCFVDFSLFNFNIDPHPTELGHQIISLKILEALAEDNNSSSNSKKDISSMLINDIEDQTYTGQAIEPEIIIKDGNTVLVEGEDYSLIYFNNVNVGEGSVAIVGTGNYTGKLIKTFNIIDNSRKDISTCTVSPLDSQLYLGMKLEPDIVILDGAKTLEKNKDYKLTYQNNVNVGTATIIITGVGNYNGTAKTNFLILPNDINLAKVQDIPDQLYTGDPITPNVVITFATAELVENKDYTLSYKNNVDTGVATIIINGIGNYTGTTTKKFNILKQPVNNSDDKSDNSSNNSSNNISSPPPKDPTTTDNNLPRAGSNSILIIAVIVLCGFSIISYKLYKKW